MATDGRLNPHRWTALAPLMADRLPPPAEIVAWYAANYPDAPALHASATSERLLVFTCGEHTLAATLVPQPIPWGRLEGPCAAAWHWPEAARAVHNHQAHAIVVLIDEPGRGIDHAMALTRVVAALVGAAQGNAVGVYWGPGRLVHAPEAFLAQARQLASDDLPLFLWIDFRVERTDQAELQIYTTGLEALGATELESLQFRGDPQELLETTYNVAHYQLTSGKRISEGDTLSVTDYRQVTARRESSRFAGGDLEVIRMEFAE